MIVVAEPRSGATRFCMDLAEKTGKKFVGEFMMQLMTETRDFGPDRKGMLHETNHQQEVCFRDISNIVKGEFEDIVLVNNECVPLVIDKADYVILRKSHTDTFISMINFWIRSRKKVGVKDFRWKDEDGNHTLFREEVGYAAEHAQAISYFITRYCYENDIKPLWYEDLFPNVPVGRETLDEMFFGDYFINMMKQRHELTDIDFFKQGLLTKFP